MDVIIARSIAGGWLKNELRYNTYDIVGESEEELVVSLYDLFSGDSTGRISLEQIVSDREFWKGLAKYESWSLRITENHYINFQTHRFKMGLLAAINYLDNNIK